MYKTIYPLTRPLQKLHGKILAFALPQHRGRVTNDFLLMLAECVCNRVLYGASELDYEIPTPGEVLDEFSGTNGSGELLLQELKSDIHYQMCMLNPNYKENINDLELVWCDDPTLTFEAWVTYSESVPGAPSKSWR